MTTAQESVPSVQSAAIEWPPPPSTPPGAADTMPPAPSAPPAVAEVPPPSAPPATAAIARPTDGLAITALVCGLLGLGLVAVIFGHIALGRIKSSGNAGSAFAIVGLVLGYLMLAAVAAGLVTAGGVTLWTLNA